MLKMLVLKIIHIFFVYLVKDSYHQSSEQIKESYPALHILLLVLQKTRKEKLFVLKENISKAEENGATYVGARLTNTRRFQCKPAILNILLSPFGKKKF